ncbi:peptidoglycan-binding protein [uncultured Roseibium sp.]|uniref:peptidoglycan-binding protein n=1 Tax=uncultured Roseibium sp. TaxID=1936171 RepID=UPI003217521A
MPGWKNRDAGRRGHERFETQDRRGRPLDDEFEGSASRRSRRAELDRVERLTRTATALGPGRMDYSDGEDELEAVAEELDRLLDTRERGGRQRSVNREPRRERPEERLEPRRGRRSEAPRSKARPAAKSVDRLDDVLGALERLDRQVQGLAGDAHYEDDYTDGYERDIDERHRGSAQPAYEPDDFDDMEPEDYDERPRRQPHRRSRRRSPDPAIHIYRDLGRRIEALRQPQEEAYGRVREELGSLKDALGGYSRGANERVGKQNAELRRLSDMVERLRVDRDDDVLAKDIRKEIADLKAMVSRTNVEGSLQTLEHGYAHILQRLDELSRATVDPRALRTLASRLNEIEDAFASLPRSEHILVLQDRIGDISERMEVLLQRKNHADIEPLRTELLEVRQFIEQIDIKGLVEGIDDRMRFVSNRLDDLEQLAREQKGLDTRLSAMEERMPAPETLSRLQGRLEEIVGMISDDRALSEANIDIDRVDNRLDEIVGRLERMEQAGPAAANDGAYSVITDRLDTITGKIEAIEKKADKPVPVLDTTASGGSIDTNVLSQLQARLNVLSEQLEQPRETVTTSDLDKLRAEIGAMRESVAAPASSEALEQRINDLAQAVQRGSSGLDENRLEQLGAKVAALAEQLETSSNRSGDMSDVATALARIESGLQETRRDVVDIAQKAAREAVSGAPATRSAEYDDAIEGLQGDLKRLLDAAEGSDERTRNTFDGVQAVLSSLTERLESLERSGDATGRSPGSFLASNAGRGAAEDTGARATVDATRERPSERVRDRKADFIAAARRAAHAASEEAAQLKADSPMAERDEDRNEARVGWLKSALSLSKKKQNRQEDAPAVEGAAETAEAPQPAGDPDHVLPGDRPAPEEPQPSSGGRRRALLFAAAAVVLAIGTLQVFKMAMAPEPGDKQVAVTTEAPAPQVTAAKAPEGAVPDTNAPLEVAGMPDKNVQAPPSAAKAVPARTNAPKPATETRDQMAEGQADGKPAPVREAAASPEPVQPAATAPSQAASAPSMAPAKSGPELAFAPPAGVNSSFGGEKVQPETKFEPGKAGTKADTHPASLVASLPPEAVGPMALRSAAASGNAAAEFLVGVKYTEGDGVPADLAEAAKWYQKAADQGLAPAQYRLASLYEKGRGVTKDLQKAKDWYLKAAEAGNAKAMHNLAVLYAEGAGGAPDFTQAAKWFESAAIYGIKDSLFNLGILYARGLGVEKDLTQSYKWFAIAAEQGDQDAAKKRDGVANSLDQTGLAKARLAVENFKLKAPEPAANKVVTDPEWADAGIGATNASVGGSDRIDYSAMVRKAQTQLNQLGFDTGTPDGEMGPRTRSAVKAFQRSLGLKETGVIDADLIKELDSQSI